MNIIQQRRGILALPNLFSHLAGVVLLCLVSIGFYASTPQSASGLVESAGNHGVHFYINEVRFLPHNEKSRQKRDDSPKDDTNPELAALVSAHDLSWVAAGLYYLSIAPHSSGLSLRYYLQSPRAPPAFS